MKALHGGKASCKWRKGLGRGFRDKQGLFRAVQMSGNQKAIYILNNGVTESDLNFKRSFRLKLQKCLER